MKPISKATLLLAGLPFIAGFVSCTNTGKDAASTTTKAVVLPDSLQDYVNERLKIYETVKLSTNINQLTPADRKILPLLIEAAQIMDGLYWKQDECG
jgi:hypothetical protein